MKYVPEIGDELSCYIRYAYIKKPTTTTSYYGSIEYGGYQYTAQIESLVSNFWAQNMEVGTHLYGNVPFIGNDYIALVKNTAENRGRILSLATHYSDLDPVLQTAGSFLFTPMLEGFIHLRFTILKTN